MFLDNDAESVSHGGEGRVGREADAEEACMGGREAGRWLLGLVDVEPRS